MVYNLSRHGLQGEREGTVEATQPSGERSKHAPAPGMHRWPGIVVFLAIGVIYALLPERLMVGPRGFLLLVVAVMLVPLIVSRLRGYHHVTRILALILTALLMIAVAVSAVFLLTRLPGKNVAAPTLLRDGALLWVANVLVFALWYWEVDSGGPMRRSHTNFRSTDFVFPQMTLDGASEHWAPDFVDYLFLAFNTSTAFSPTDTMVLSRRAKVLMMLQAIISLMVISVLVARAINIL